MDNDVRQAVLELAGFYGMTAGDKYIKAIVNDGNDTTAALAAAEKAAKESPASVFTESKKKFPTVEKAVETINKLAHPNVHNSIAITPHKDGMTGIDKDLSYVNKFGKKKNGSDQGKGAPANKEFYTVDDLRGKEEKAAVNTGATPVHLIQVFPAASAPTTVNTELVALWLNSIPALEMSRAVPFLDIRVSLGVPNSPDAPKPMSLAKFLIGDTLPSNLTDDAKNIVKANFVKESDAGQAEGGEAAELDENTSIVSAMEVFTSPQTMVGKRTSDKSDPFRPLMSFLDMSISLSPAGGMMAFKTASMNLILHDRTRLKEVLSLVAPGGNGSTQIEVTYGWSHPDHNKLMRKSDASVNNRYGKLINAMRVTEVYNVTVANYKFTDTGEVELDVSLALAGTHTAASKEVTDPVVADKEKELNKFFVDLTAAIGRIRSKSEGGKVDLPKYVTSSTNLGGAALIARKDANKIKSFIARNKRKKGDLGEIKKLLQTIYGKDGKKGKLKSLKVSKSKILTQMLSEIKKTPDPFLPRRSIGNVTANDMRQAGNAFKYRGQKYVSLGKLLGKFLADSLAVDKDYKEVQLIFYPINESASYAHTINLAQFPVEIEDFEEIMKQKFGVHNRMTLGAFVRIINSYFIRDQGSEVYGMSSLFGSRNKDDKKKVLTSRKKARKYQKADVFGDKKLKILRTAYGMEDNDSGTSFRMPNVTLRFEVAPSTDLEKGADPILRVHVMDQSCGKAEQLKDAFMAFGGDGVFSVITRKAETKLPSHVRTPNHAASMSEHLAALETAKVIEKAKEHAVLKDSLTSDELAKLEGVYLLRTSLPPDNADTSAAFGTTITASDKDVLSFNAKDKIMSLFPAVVYGSAHSNITTADLGTVADSAMNTIMMLRQSKSDADKDIGSDNGLPLQVMPTQLSIETYGCPYVSFGQQVFVDFGTNTTADNFYAVVGLEHKFASGEFTTDIQMAQLDAFGTFRSALDSSNRMAAIVNLVYPK